MAFVLAMHRDVCNLFVFLCFQSGGRGATHSQEEKRVGGNKLPANPWGMGSGSSE